MKEGWSLQKILFLNLKHKKFSLTDHDGAEPAGNSITAQNLLLLSAYYEEPKYKDRALKLFQFFHYLSPFGYVMPELLSAMLMNEKGLTSLVVVGRSYLMF